MHHNTKENPLYVQTWEKKLFLILTICMLDFDISCVKVEMLPDGGARGR